MTDFTPETPVVTPIRDHAAELAKAEAGVAEMAAKRNNRWYPKYHIASNGGWINDPVSNPHMNIIQDLFE